MKLSNANIMIIVVVIFAFYLIYSQNNQPKYLAPAPIHNMAHFDPALTVNNDEARNKNNDYRVHKKSLYATSTPSTPPCPPPAAAAPVAAPVAEPQAEERADPYSDPIKRQDLYGMSDPLTFPQMRLSREILEKYQKYQQEHGNRAPFGIMTRPMFDNPQLNGFLMRQQDENEPFPDANIPPFLPLFRMKSVKSSNRFFYYVIDPRFSGKIEYKFSLNNVKVNGVRQYGAESYGLAELFEEDIVENVVPYTGAKFKVTLYPTHHFP